MLHVLTDWQWGVFVVVLTLLIRQYLVTSRILNRMRRVLARVEAEPPARAMGTAGDAAEFPWLGWIARQVTQRRVATLSDRTAAVVELQRELDEIPGYTVLNLIGPYMPVVGVVLTAVTAAATIDPQQGLGSIPTPKLLWLSSAFMFMAMFSFFLYWRLRRKSTALERAALTWFETQAARYPGAPDRGEDLRRLLGEMREPLVRLDERCSNLENAVTRLGEASESVASGLIGQQRVLEVLAPLGGELRELRISNEGVANGTQRVIQQSENLLRETTSQIGQFAEVVTAYRDALSQLGAGQVGIAQAQESLGAMLARAGEGLEGGFQNVASAQLILTTQVQDLADRSGQLRETMSLTDSAFRECGMQVRGVVEGLGTQMEHLSEGILAWRGVITETLAPTAWQQSQAATTFRSAADSINESARRMMDGSGNVIRATEELRTSHGQISEAVDAVTATLREATRALDSSTTVGQQLEAATAGLGPAVANLSETVERAGSTVKGLDAVGDRVADGLERRLTMLDKQALTPTVERLRELRGLFEQLQRDLNFSGAMQDFVNCIHELWRAAQEQQDAALALRGGARKTWWEVFFGRQNAPRNGRHQSVKETKS
jgi:methyl-accepting chemotaxis protein